MAIWGTYDDEFSDEIASNYEVKMAQHGLLVATRHRIRFINKEFDFQFSGLVHDNDIKAYGQMMGVSKIVLIEAQHRGNWRDISVIDIEKGVILYSANIYKDMILENILKENNISSKDSKNVSKNQPTYLPFYFEVPLKEIDIDFFFGGGGGILHYYGYRPNKDEFLSVINRKFFEDTISPSETLLTQSYYSIDNNTALDERIKVFMRSNNLTFCFTFYLNEYGGFTYVVNYSFDNYKTFGFVSMDTYGYNSSSER
jgi:hypothetical protein